MPYRVECVCVFILSVFVNIQKTKSERELRGEVLKKSTSWLVAKIRNELSVCVCLGVCVSSFFPSGYLRLCTLYDPLYMFIVF